MRFEIPLPLADIHRVVDPAYYRDNAAPPRNYNPTDDVLNILVSEERSFIIRNNKLYINWQYVNLADVFSDVLDTLSDILADGEIVNNFAISTIFRSYNMGADYRRNAVETFLENLDSLAGYDTGIPEYCISFSFQDLERFWNAYSRDINPLPNFREEVRRILGDYAIRIIEMLDQTPPTPVEYD